MRVHVKSLLQEGFTSFVMLAKRLLVFQEKCSRSFLFILEGSTVLSPKLGIVDLLLPLPYFLGFPVDIDFPPKAVRGLEDGVILTLSEDRALMVNRRMGRIKRCRILRFYFVDQDNCRIKALRPDIRRLF